MTRKPKKTLWFLLISWLAVAIPLSHAQTDDDDDEDVFELSPFEVNTSDDSGYYATSTLAGSRIKTDLKDVASSISVITKEFMDDVGASDAASLLTYTLGTEVGGAKGNFTGVPASSGTLFTDTDGLNRSPNFTNRIRGLAGADQTRDFFLSSVPWDSYNVDRVDINRGSNSFLFGLGSAAGIINTNTINPIFNERKTKVELKYGRFGSTSAVLDHNEPLLDGKLAARVAFKYGDEQYMQKQAFMRDKRAFGAIDYRPFKHTKIKVKLETGSIDSNKPEQRPPLDNMTHWLKMGQPIFHHPTSSWINQGPVAEGHIDITEVGARKGRPAEQIYWVSGPLMFWSGTPDRWDASLWGIEGKGAWVNENWTNNGGGTYVDANGNPKAVGAMISIPDTTEYYRMLHKGEVGANNWTAFVMSDPNVFDFYENLAVGDNKWEGQEWDAWNITLEQTIPVINAVVQATIDNQKHNYSFVNTWGWKSLAFFPEVNSHLIDGRPNPHLNKPYMSSAGWASAVEDEKETIRVTAFKEFNLEESLNSNFFGKLLGRHSITLNYSDYTKDVLQQGGRPQIADPEFWSVNPWNYRASNADPVRKRTTHGSRAIGYFAYVGDAVAPGGNAYEANIRPVNFSFLNEESIPIRFFNVNYDNWLSGEGDLGDWDTYTSNILQGRKSDMSEIHSDWAWRLSREEIKSYSAVLQSTMLDDAIVATMGWREDDYKSYRAPGAQQDEFIYTTPPLPDQPDLSQKETTFNYGIVARLPRAWRHYSPFGLDFSVFYNESDNFSPTPPRVDILTNQLSPPKGVTEEYGFMIDSADGKFNLRTTFYETAETGASVDNRIYNNQIVRGLENAILATIAGYNDESPVLDDFVTWLKSDTSLYIRDAFDYVIDYDENGMPSEIVSKDEKHGILLETRDTVSKGYEVEIVYNPLHNWRIAVNYSNQEAVSTNSSRASLEFLQDLRRDLNGPIGQISENRFGTRLLGERLIEFENGILRQVALDDFPNIEIRENRLNIISNYWFADGPLKGVSIGGAIRWQDEVAIGNGYIVDDQLGEIPDINNLYWGPSETNIDLWVGYGTQIFDGKVDWKIQLNVQNVGADKELIPVGTQPDGTVAAWRIAPTMIWTIRNTFTF